MRAIIVPQFEIIIDSVKLCFRIAKMNSDEEKPVFKTCLGVPISVALTIWAVLRLIFVIAAVIFHGYNLLLVIAFGHGRLFTTLSIYPMLIVIFIALVVDVPFLIILIVGICQQSRAILKVIYYYEIYVIAFEAFTTIVILYVTYTRDPHFSEPIMYILLFTIALIILLVDTSVCLALKSKLAIMRNSELPEFLKMTGEDKDNQITE